jgi:hypothetical protein
MGNVITVHFGFAVELIDPLPSSPTQIMVSIDKRVSIAIFIVVGTSSLVGHRIRREDWEEKTIARAAKRNRAPCPMRSHGGRIFSVELSHFLSILASGRQSVHLGALQVK